MYALNSGGMRPFEAGLETSSQLKWHLFSHSRSYGSRSTDLSNSPKAEAKQAFFGESGKWLVGVLHTTDMLGVLLEWQLVGNSGLSK